MRILALFFLVFIFASNNAEGKTKFKNMVLLPRKKPVEIAHSVEKYIRRHRLNTLLGINISHGSAMVSGFEFGYGLSSNENLFLALESNFSLYSGGSVLGIMAGGWIDFHPFSSPKIGVSIGGLAGSAFSTQLAFMKTTAFVAFIDAAFVQKLDDLSDVRVQLRPGIMDTSFAFMLNFNVSFHI